MGIQINGQIDTISAVDGSLSISGQSIENVNLNLSQNLNVTGIATLGTSIVGSAVTINSTGIRVSGIVTANNVVVGGSTTALVVNGDARITGILTVGSGSITINGSSNSISGISTVYTSSLNGGQLGGSRNMVINGSMVVNQRGWTGTAGTTTDTAYVTDRWKLSFSHDGSVSAGQTSMTSGNAFDDGFRNALFFRVNTADASLAAGQYQIIRQNIEGYNVQGIKKGTANAQPVTLSFWARSTTTGTYIAELEDTDNTRQVSQAYTINSADTWEKKVLTFPADTISAFDNDNASSLSINWWLAAGSTYSSGTLNTSWAANTNANRVVGQTNLLASAGNNFWLTGVQLEVGDRATEFERRSYGQELALCKRYYRKGLALGGNNNGSFFWSYYGGINAVKTFDIDMSSLRGAPNLSLLNNSNVEYYSYGGVWTSTTAVITTLGAGWPNNELYLYANTDGDGRGKLLRCTNATDVFWVADSEL